MKDNDKYYEKAKENAEKIRYEINTLKSFDLKYAKQFNEFWTKVKEINLLFKNLKPLSETERKNLWNEFGNKCQETKKLQSENDEYIKRDSKHKKSIVEEMIKSALNYDFENTSGFINANNKLQEALLYMKDGWPRIGETFFNRDIEGWEGKMTKEDKGDCWQQWKKTKDILKQKKKDFWYANYLNFKSKLSSVADTACYGDPYDAINEIKDLQKKLKQFPMEQVYWEEMKQSLNHYWEKAIQRIKEKKKLKEKKGLEWRDKTESAIERFSGLIDKNEGVVDGLNNQIDKLKDEIVKLGYELINARTDSYRERVQSWIDEKLGWIEEKQDKIRDIMRTNEELGSKINDMRERLGN